MLSCMYLLSNLQQIYIHTMCAGYTGMVQSMHVGVLGRRRREGECVRTPVVGVLGERGR